MEVSQAICLSVFFAFALLISPKRFDEIILDFYQDAGIWIVIASCVAEYLLLLTYIGVAAYDFFKNRKMMKKMNVQRRTYEFLKFDESHRDVGNRWREPGTRLQALGKNQQCPQRPGKTPEIKHHPLTLPKELPKKIIGLPPKGISKGRALRAESNNAPNNPQLLKFDGDSQPASENKLPRRHIKRARRMNKSLKRKQIE